jgi:glycosyltransferase involved in cell wall biosynthesis
LKEAITLEKGTPMRVVVATDSRFLRGPDGKIYSTTICNYSFWGRYLQVFDEVIVLARVKNSSENEPIGSPASGQGVRFMALPTFRGPWQFLRHYNEMNAFVKNLIDKSNAYILRAPASVATLLWRHLQKNHLPYGMEVIGDPQDSLAQGGVKSFFLPVIRRKMRRDLVQQCRYAAVASYVTKFTLQERYPPGGWSTHYSSIELTDQAIINEDELSARLARTNEAVCGKRPLRICHIGTMETLYKGQDILLNAVWLCRKKGSNIELTFLGEGQFQPYLSNKAKQLGLNEYVHFLGRLPPGKPVIEQLDAADLFVLPSIAEGLPRSLIEAMARGLPCIASNVGGIPELLAADDLVACRDAKALAEKIEMVLRNQSRLKQMARTNLKVVQEYRADKLNHRRLELYKKLSEETS